MGMSENRSKDGESGVGLNVEFYIGYSAGLYTYYIHLCFFYSLFGCGSARITYIFQFGDIAVRYEVCQCREHRTMAVALQGG